MKDAADVVCRGCRNTGYGFAGEPCSCGSAEPITGEWLSANGWKSISPRNDSHTRMPGFRLLTVGGELVCGRLPFHSPDDLCIGLAPTGTQGEWHCWVYQMEPYRHIHVRHVRYVWEVVRLWEGLTGSAWDQGVRR